ncbi:MAG: type II secretion system major pseudopilin GspG [Deltaproteobacteria bacterium]|nr:type II secretion system major pseudopilin GspG [Deltaproteobacteria bacterium]NIS76735.1 type II secretion system major pseudopilin GspG [Deltaproteobacteria bacterium]
MNRKEWARAGFTLIEIMVVIIILGLLAGLVIPKLVGRTEEAKKTQVKLQIRNIEQALKLFKLDNGFYPSTEQGLQALVTKPEIGRVPANYRNEAYIDRVPKDPWGSEYIYIYPGERGDYDIVSYGADGIPGGEGEDADITSLDE